MRRAWPLSLLPVLLAVANRIRGGGWGIHDALPGRGLYYVAAGIGLLAWWLHSWKAGVGFGVGYLVWGVPGWGRWIGLERHTVERNSLTIRIVEGIAKHLPTVGWWTFYHNALTVRMAIVTPVLISVGWWIDEWALIVVALPAPVLMTLCYEAGWRYWNWTDEQAPAITVAEFLVGTLWAGWLVVALA